PPKGSTAAWEEITALCARQTGFTLKAKKWNALKSRFNLLVSSFRKDEGASLRKSGAPEEYEEREVLLCDIINRMDDYKESEDASRELRKAKTDGIVNSGLLLRRLAVEERFIQAIAFGVRRPSKKEKKKPSSTKRESVAALAAVITAGIEAKRASDAENTRLAHERFEQLERARATEMVRIAERFD
ncbi:unnamed protein product, partial [Aphanomyces euteiches]